MFQLKTTWQHLRRSPYQAMAAIMIITLTFFAASVLVLIVTASESVLKFFESKPQITAFFKNDLKKEELDNLENILRQTDKVANLKYISQEEALAIYREQNKNDPLLLEMVSANILPASLEVSATKVSYLGELAAILKKQEKAEEVIFQEDVVNSLTFWTNAVRKAGFILVGFLTMVSLLIVLMAIGMKIAQRKEEIEILKLIGAGSWFIRGPFLAEGAVYGITGAFSAWIITYILLLYLTPFLASFFAGIPLFPVSPQIMLRLLFLEIVSGTLVGSFGSFLAILRYLRI